MADTEKGSVSDEHGKPRQSRRKFLAQAAAASGVVVAGGAAAADAGLTVPPWSKREGRPLLANAYGLPSPFEKNVVRRGRGDQVMPGSGSVMTPLQDLRGMITPNGLVFERSHAGVPEIDPAQHRLAVHGLVKQPLLLTMEDITRFPSVSRIHFLECSGNTSREWRSPFAPTVQISHGLLSCCEWTGVLLSTVLEEAGISPGAAWIMAEGADASGMNRSVPLHKCLEDAMLVYAQNGEALRPENGYPLRLFLPGYEGNMSIKWLRRLKVGAEPFMTREETSKYTDSMADGSARQFTFDMDVKSVITSPSGGQKMKQRGFVEISGLAWSGRGRIARVDVSTDGGRTWRDATLQSPVLTRSLTRFRLPWQWDGRESVLQSRAVDEGGHVQPTVKQLVAARGLNSIYHYNAIQSWKIAAGGEITNVHA